MVGKVSSQCWLVTGPSCDSVSLRSVPARMSERSHGRLLVLLLLLVRLAGAEFRFPSGEEEEEEEEEVMVTVSQEAARRLSDGHELPGEVQAKTKITVGGTKHLRGNSFLNCQER